MKFFIGTALTAAVAVCVSAQSEMSWTLDKAEDWVTTPTQTLIVKDGVITASGSVRLISKRAFPVDAAKTYTIAAELRQTAGLPRNVYVGFVPLDSKGNPISFAKVSARKGTETVLTRPVKKGAKEIWIKANKKWEPVGRLVKKGDAIAWNVKEDYSDLPNSNIAFCEIVNVETVNDEMKVTMRKPIKVDLPAGTTVRCHGDGGSMYTAGYGIPGRNDFKRFEGSAKGILDFGLSSTSWPKGTKRCHIILLLNWNGQKTGQTELRNMKLTVK